MAGGAGGAASLADWPAADETIAIDNMIVAHAVRPLVRITELPHATASTARRIRDVNYEAGASAVNKVGKQVPISLASVV